MQELDVSIHIKHHSTRMILLLVGGAGGIQSGPNMLTELQQAHRPHLNALMRKALSGLHQVAAPGQTPAPVTALQKLLHVHAGETPSWEKKFKISGCIITADAAYQQIGRLCDFNVVTAAPAVSDLIDAACRHYPEHEFLLIHHTQAQEAGLQGGYYEKVKALEALDFLVPQLVALKPDVLVVTGDHSCPSALREITWHPLPLMINAQSVRYDLVQTFDEISCIAGALGIVKTQEILSLMFAHAGRLNPVSS